MKRISPLKIVVSVLISAFIVSCSQEDSLQEIEDTQVAPSKEKVTLFNSNTLKNVVEYPDGEYNFSGLNFAGWEVVIGDANYVMNGEAPITINDIETEHQDSLSVLSANVDNRYIMTHNITYKKLVSSELMNMKHTAEYEFKIPYQVSTANVDNNGQTVEGGLFIWDGEDTQLDYGLAFQWITNPWVPEYGDIRYWDGANWLYLTNVPVDTAYHKVIFELDIENESASLTIDGVSYANTNAYSETPKVGWGTTVDGRLQAEVISIFPSAQAASTPMQEIYFKDWLWEGEYYE